MRNKSVAVASGQVVRARRLELNLTQLQLAKATKTDRVYPSLLERGLRTPKMSTFLNLAAGLELHPEVLLTLLLQQMATRKRAA